jgi:hypothetical protein
VGELSICSERFRQLWARHDIRPKGTGTSIINHTEVGRLELGYAKLPIPDTDRQTLAVYHAAPGSRTAQSLTLLATAIATPVWSDARKGDERDRVCGEGDGGRP